jgi:hypothetical protein
MHEGDWILEINGTNVDNMTLTDFISLVKKMIGQTYPAKILKWNKIYPAIKASHKISQDTTQERRTSDSSNVEGNEGKSAIDVIFEDWERLGSAPSENTRNKLASQRKVSNNDDSNNLRQTNSGTFGSGENDTIAEALKSQTVEKEKPHTQRENNSEKTKKMDTHRSKSSEKVTLQTNNEVCDICGNPDNYLDSMVLQKCSVCGVMVHEDCYGLHNEQKEEKYSDWKCHACASEYTVLYLIWHSFFHLYLIT